MLVDHCGRVARRSCGHNMWLWQTSVHQEGVFHATLLPVPFSPLCVTVVITQP